MRIIVTKDYNDMSRKAANIISAQIITKPDCVLGLATGSSPVGAYKTLVDWYKKGDLDFSEVTHIQDGTEPDAQKACDDFEAIVKNCGGTDLQLLGLGHNGHIGFNEPAEDFPKFTHCVDLTESTIQANARFFDKPEDVPTQAYTMGIGTIMRAKRILLIASGKDKAAIVKEALFGPVRPQVPASILQLHPDVTVVLDEEAASCL